MTLDPAALASEARTAKRAARDTLAAAVSRMIDDALRQNYSQIRKMAFHGVSIGVVDFRDLWRRLTALRSTFGALAAHEERSITDAIRYVCARGTHGNALDGLDVASVSAEILAIRRVCSAMSDPGGRDDRPIIEGDARYCPLCGHGAAYEPAHAAEPDTNTSAWRGGWSCDRCDWIAEDDPREEPEPFDECTGPCGPDPR